MSRSRLQTAADRYRSQEAPLSFEPALWAVPALLGGIALLAFPVLLVLGGAIAAAVVLVTLPARLRIDRIGLILLLNFALWIGSALFVGAATFFDLFDPRYIGGDGRIFIAYIPLLMFSLVPADVRYTRLAERSVVWIGYFTMLLWAVWLPTHAPLLSEGKARNFAGFLTSHTGSGTFLGFLIIFLGVLGAERRDKRLLWLSAFLLLPLFSSASRAGLVAFAAGAGWYLLRRIGRKAIILMVLALPLLAAVMFFTARHTFNRTLSAFDPQLIEAAANTLESSGWSPGEEREVEGTNYNILSRFLFWSYGVKRFQESPFLGIGFGRYNDPKLTLSGPPGVVRMAFEGDKRFYAGTAHNTYIHVLSENGILGLALLAALWIAVLRRLRAIQAHNAMKELRTSAVAAEALIPYLAAAALFGHSFASPSVTFPVMAVIGTLIACDRTWRPIATREL